MIQKSSLPAVTGSLAEGVLSGRRAPSIKLTVGNSTNGKLAKVYDDRLDDYQNRSYHCTHRKHFPFLAIEGTSVTKDQRSSGKVGIGEGSVKSSDGEVLGDIESPGAEPIAPWTGRGRSLGGKRKSDGGEKGRKDDSFEHLVEGNLTKGERWKKRSVVKSLLAQEALMNLEHV